MSMLPFYRFDYVDYVKRPYRNYKQAIENENAWFTLFYHAIQTLCIKLRSATILIHTDMRGSNEIKSFAALYKHFILTVGMRQQKNV